MTHLMRRTCLRLHSQGTGRRWSSTSSVPIVDVKMFVDGSITAPEREKLVKEIKDAAEHVGFLQVKGLPVSPDVVSRAYQSLREFFAQPDEVKRQIHTSKTGGLRGYIGLYEQGNYGIDVSDKRHEAGITETNEDKDFKELFTMGTELPTDYAYYHGELFAQNVWPALPSFRENIEAYYNDTWRAAHYMFQLFALALHLEMNYFIPHITHPMNSMNCLHYPPKPRAVEVSTGIGSHTDYECFTLLSQDGVAGLEILNDNGVWESVEPIEGAYVVNIGDMLARWSNGTMKSTVHRARNHPEKDRYCMAFFCCCNYDTHIASLVPGEAKYPPVVAGDHLLQRILRANADTLG